MSSPSSRVHNMKLYRYTDKDETGRMTEYVNLTVCYANTSYEDNFPIPHGISNAKKNQYICDKYDSLKMEAMVRSSDEKAEVLLKRQKVANNIAEIRLANELRQQEIKRQATPTSQELLFKGVSTMDDLRKKFVREGNSPNAPAISAFTAPAPRNTSPDNIFSTPTIPTVPSIDFDDDHSPNTRAWIKAAARPRNLVKEMSRLELTDDSSNGLSGSSASSFRINPKQ